MKRLCLRLALLLPAGLLIALAGSEGTEDNFLPWEGGAAYYGRWVNGPPSDPSFIPISVWYQRPSNAARYKSIGVNLYIGPIEVSPGESVDALNRAGMAVIAVRNEPAASRPNERLVRGWFLLDEPDNAQEKPGRGYGACLYPGAVMKGYKEIRAADPTRPVLLNLGQAVANEGWVGRGDACAGHWEHYPQYAEAADIVGFDVYPVNGKLPLWFVGQGIDRLRGWARFRKPVFSYIETSSFDGGPKPSPSDMKSEVWMSIIHGAMGIGYFCHQFKPTFNDAAPLDDPPVREALASLNAQIHALAPVLNTPSVANGVTVTSSSSDVPVDYMLKRHAGATYLLAVAARPGGPIQAAFNLRDCHASITAEVLGEARTIEVRGGKLEDRFGTYQVHLYRLPFVPGGKRGPDRREESMRTRRTTRGPAWEAKTGIPGALETASPAARIDGAPTACCAAAEACRGSLDPQSLAIFNADRKAWEVVPGEYTFYAGGSSVNTPLHAVLRLAGASIPEPRAAGHGGHE